MTIVHGQIESLNKVKDTLIKEGFIRFNSIGDINAFFKTYDTECRDIEAKTEEALDEELDQLREQIKTLKHKFEEFSNNEVVQLQFQEDAIKERIRSLQSTESKNVLLNIFGWIKSSYLKISKFRLERKILGITRKETKIIKVKWDSTKAKFDTIRLNKPEVLKERSNRALKDLKYTKEILDSLQPWIAGAVGENKVKKELEKFPDNHFLFNDFSMYFDKPIYNRKEKDKIFSVQIDHLLLTPAGIFVVETKNWSKASIDNIDMRSPVQQIKRTSFALFVLVNNSKKDDIAFNSHHWGEKEIPIRNLIVMINSKPKEKFKFVTIKTLKELNSYVSYFDPIFTNNEVSNIADYLITLKNKYQSSHKVTRKASTQYKKTAFSSAAQKPTFAEWLQKNPGKGVNDYYSKFGK